MSLRKRLGLLLALLGIVAGLMASEARAGEEEAFAGLRECLVQERQLSVVFLIDESGSLQQSDRDDLRVDAAKAALQNLSMLSQEAQAAGDTSGVEVSVLLAGFGEDYYDRSEGWHSLQRGTAQSLYRVLDEFAKPVHEGDQDTDYVRALLGAERDLQGRSGCRMVMWFTDGQYDIASTELRPEYEARIPDGDPAPTPGQRPEVYEAIGSKWLCEDFDAISDGYRQSGTYLVTVALAIEPREAKLFTERITEGRDGVGTTCGAQWQEGRSLGAFLEVEHTEELLWIFDEVISIVRGLVEIPVEAPSGSEFEFLMTYGLTDARVLVASGTDEFRAWISSPEAGPVELDMGGGGDFSLGSARVTPTWLSDQAFVLDVSLDQQSTAWVGAWRLTFDSAPEARVRVGVVGFIDIDPVESSIQAEPGESVAVLFDAYNRAGTPPTLEAAQALPPSALVTGPGISERVQGRWRDAGRFEIEYRIPQDAPDGSRFEFTPSVEIRFESVRIPFDGEPATVSVNVPPPPPPPPPVTPPSITASPIDFGEVLGVTPSQVNSAITVTGGSDDGCVFLVGTDLGEEAAPEAVSVAVLNEDGVPLPQTATDCGAAGSPGFVAAGAETRLSVRLTPEADSQVDIAGTIHLGTAEPSGKEDSAVVRFNAELRKEPRPGLGLAVLLLLLGLGLAGPFGVVYAVARLSARFKQEPTDLQWQAIGITANPALRQLRPAASPGGRLVVVPKAFEGVGQAGSKSHLTLPCPDAPVELRARGRLLQRAYGETHLEGHLTVGSSPVGEGPLAAVPLDLDRTWVFVIKPEDLHADGTPMTGQLILIESALEEPGVSADGEAVLARKSWADVLDAAAEMVCAGVETLAAETPPPAPRPPEPSDDEEPVTGDGSAPVAGQEQVAPEEPAVPGRKRRPGFRDRRKARAADQEGEEGGSDFEVPDGLDDMKI